MRYKITATVPGEPKSRQLFAPDPKAASDAVSLMLLTVPVGTRVQKWETVDTLIATFIKKPEEKKEETEGQTT